MPAAATDIAFVFRRPFEEQVAFFRGKLGNLVPTATWKDMMRAQHDRAFMVAGAAKADLLADLAAAVDKAISDGESLDAFRRRFGDIVKKHGWHGWTGEGTQAGTNWRTRVIYRTNMATSYAAGRLAQLKHFPLWVYRHSGAEHPRLQHKAWDGMTLPADHEFWQTHYPPNGWGCGCRVVGAGSTKAAERLGGNPDYDAPPRGWDARDAKGRLPGIDEGWDYMPGASTYDDLQAFLARKAAALPAPLRQAFSLEFNRYPLLQADEADIDTLTATGREVLNGLLDERLSTDRAVVPVITMRGRTLREALAAGHADWTEEIFSRRVLEIAAEARPMGGRLDITSQRGKARKLADRVGGKLPADWVEAINGLGPARVVVREGRGSFRMESDAGAARLLPRIITDETSTAEHEWMHAAQRAMPRLDAMFQKVHRIRTRDEPLIARNGEFYRKDEYVDIYFGREYVAKYHPDAEGGAYEVITMTYQALLGRDYYAKYHLHKMLLSDHDLLSLAIGALLRYKP